MKKVEVAVSPTYEQDLEKLIVEKYEDGELGYTTDYNRDKRTVQRV